MNWIQCSKANDRVLFKREIQVEHLFGWTFPKLIFNFGCKKMGKNKPAN